MPTRSDFLVYEEHGKLMNVNRNAMRLFGAQINNTYRSGLKV